jgi:hypothetical protein
MNKIFTEYRELILKVFELTFTVKHDDSCNKEYLPIFNTIVFENTVLVFVNQTARCKERV